MEMRRMVRRRLLAVEAAAAAVISLLVLSMDLASNGGSLSAYMAPEEVLCAKNSSDGSELHARGRDSCGDPGAAHAVQSSSSNLSSMLTAKRFQPWVADLDQLPTDDDYIGYQPEGFACSVLMKKGIKQDRLNPYNNRTEYSEALSKGSKNGGGSATIDEIPYFRSDEHSKTYEMMVVDIPYRTPGHGFIAPLVHDVWADSILDIADGYEESQIDDFAVDIYDDRFKYCIVEEFYQEMFDAVGDMNITVDGSRNMTDDFTFNTGSDLLALPHKKSRRSVYVRETWISNETFNGTEGIPFIEYYGFSCSSLALAHNDSKPPTQWIFFKPLTKELWLATVCFVFFTGFVFWMIERSINPLFQGPSLAQFSTALYFVFSTLTFSHGQILRSPLSKIVLVVWCFAVLVLVQSYVATLSSMLAAEVSVNNGSSSGPVSAPLTLQSFSGIFVVTGCISALMLLISLTRSAIAAYTRVRNSESQNDAENGSVVPEPPVQEVRDNDSQGAHVNSAISGDEEAGGVMQDSMPNASEPAPDVYVQIEMTS